MLTFILCVSLLLFAAAAITGAPYVPSIKQELARCFTELLPLGEKDFLVDLGAGDGAVLRAACEKGARAMGVEINPLLVLVARWRLRKLYGAKVVFGNMFRVKFPKKTTAVYVFGDSRDMQRVFEKVEAEAKRLDKDLWLISNGFAIGDQKAEKEFRAFYLYKVCGEK